MTEPHARPGLSVEEHAARVELALAQADRAEDRRRIIAEAIEAAIGGHKNDLWAAWRATLGTAAAMADVAAFECEQANSRRGRVNQRGHFGSVLLKGLGDRLFALRDADPAEHDTTMASLLGRSVP